MWLQNKKTLSSEEESHESKSRIENLRGFVKQVEFYFSEQNLVRDLFLRNRMDSSGYVYVTVVSNFSAARAKAKNTPHSKLVEALMGSELLQVKVDSKGHGILDAEAAALAKVRVKQNWKRWLTTSSNKIENHLSYFQLSKSKTL